MEPSDEIKQTEQELQDITEGEYLEEMKRMLPLVKGSKRLAFLLAYVRIANEEFNVESPEDLMRRFVHDMDVLSGKVVEN